VKQGGKVFDITNHWFEFLPGHSGDASSFSMNTVRDLGDGHATIRDLPMAGVLVYDYPSTGDFPLSIFGTDNMGLPVEQHFTTKGFAPNNFVHIDRIRKSRLRRPPRSFITQLTAR
jgi:hypothetical protein